MAEESFSDIYKRLKETFGTQFSSLVIVKEDAKTKTVEYILTVSEKGLEFQKKSEFQKTEFSFTFDNAEFSEKGAHLPLNKQKMYFSLIKAVFLDLEENLVQIYFKPPSLKHDI